MFVVMTVGASEAEILGVKSQILAEGLTPFDHVSAERTTIAVVGEIGARRPVLLERFAALPGVDDGHPDQPPVQADLARVPSGGHGHPRPRRGHRRRVADDDGRAVLGREPRAAVRDGRCGEGGRRDDPARRRVQAADQPVRVPGSRRRRACATWPRRASGPACRSSPRSWSRPRSTSSPSTPTSSRSAPGTCRTTRCCGMSAGRPAGDAQARLRRDGRGVADGRRVHRQLRQPERDPVRARHPDVRDVHPQHDGPGRGAAARPADPPAGHRRSEPRHRQALAGQAAGARRRRGRGRRGHGRGPPEPGRGAVGRRAAADPRPVPRHDGRRHAAPAQVRGIHARGSAAGARAACRRPRTGWPSIDRRRRRRASAPAHACAASCGCPATSRSATGRCMLARAGRWREPHQRRRRRRRRPLDGRHRGRARARPSSGSRATARRVGYRVVSGGADALAAPDGELDCGNSGHEPPADERRARGAAPDRRSSTATIHCAAARWLVSSSHCARWVPSSMAGKTIPSHH